MGAAAVFATAADTPPMRKSIMKELKSLGFLSSDILRYYYKVSSVHVVIQRRSDGFISVENFGSTIVDGRDVGLGRNMSLK